MPARLTITAPDLTPREMTLTGDEAIVGRPTGEPPGPDLAIAEPSVSRRHARLRLREGRYTLEDLHSTNGTWVNGNPLPPGVEVTLGQHSYFQVGRVQLLVTYPEEGEYPAPPPSEEERRSTVAPTGRFTVSEVATIGRDPSCDIVLPFPQVSLRHAEVRRVGAALFVADLGSAAGTFLNGRRVTRPSPLRPGDLIQVGASKLHFDGRVLVRFDEQGTARLEAVRLCKEVPGPRGPVCVLRDVSLAVHPREFLAIVGPSGSGKSTLLHALSGYAPATSGRVFLNGWDLYRSASAFAPMVGYVPQEEIIHAELTPWEALSYAALLRFPPDVSAMERQERVEQVLSLLGLAGQRDVRISHLSGGQRKRVSIGAELLCGPGLLFLDEPTSGLDPGLERQMMMLLRQTADAGCTVILITHATQNIGMVDLVAFMGVGGTLCFLGTPGEALEFFSCSDFAEVYEKVGQTEDTARAVHEAFVASDFHARHVCDRLQHLEDEKAGERPAPRLRCVEPASRLPSLRQLATLSRRGACVLGRDTRNFGLLVLQAPLIALVISLAFRFDRYLFNPALRPPWDAGHSALMQPKILLFLMVIAMVWLGTSSAAREIVKERAIMRRERMVSLRLGAYLGSKCLVLGALAAVQTALLLLTLSLFIRLEHAGYQGGGRLFGVLFLVALSGAAMGLLVSALVTSVDQAGSVVPLLLLPQIALSGGLIPVEKPGLRELSWGVATRWGYRAAARVQGLSEYYDEVVAVAQGAARVEAGALEAQAMREPPGARRRELLRRRDSLLASVRVRVAAARAIQADVARAYRASLGTCVLALLVFCVVPVLLALGALRYQERRWAG